MAGATADESIQAPHELTTQQIGEMADKLATRLEAQPEDAQGWVMLARTSRVVKPRRIRSRLSNTLPTMGMRRSFITVTASSGVSPKLKRMVMRTSSGSCARRRRSLALDKMPAGFFPAFKPISP